MNMMTLPSLRAISVAFLRGKVKNGSLVGVARLNSVKPVYKRQYLQISSSTIPSRSSIWSNHIVLVTLTLAGLSTQAGALAFEN